MLLPALLLTAAAVQDDVAPDPAAALAAAVDLPTPRERLEAAQALAERRDVSLEDWLAACRAFGPSGPAPEAGPLEVSVPLWVEGQWEQTDLHGYVPEGVAHGAPAPLLLHAHGSGGSGAGQWAMWVEVADALGMIVLCPSEAGENLGYGSSERERRNPLAALRWARRRFDVDENAIFVTGISRGGHLAWDLILRHPDLWAGAAPMIGGPRFQTTAGHNNMRFVSNVAHLPIRDLQGAQDQALLLVNLRVTFDLLRELGNGDAVLHEFPHLGHMYDIHAVDWEDFYGSRRRDPLPARVRRAATRPAEGRAFWLETLKLDRDVEDVVTKLVVKDRKFGEYDEEKKRRVLQPIVEAKTGLVDAELLEPGRIRVDAERVDRVRLLLVPAMLDGKGRLNVLWNGRKKVKRPKEDAEVLLSEFVERFDRTFLPLAAVEIP